MGMDLLVKKYQVINPQMVLFNEEYYLSVLKVPVNAWDDQRRGELFDLLYAFEHPDMELEIDISEEAQGTWYLQLLVPAMLTLPEAAYKRIERGLTALTAYWQEQGHQLAVESLLDEAIYAYVKRYNPNLAVTS